MGQSIYRGNIQYNIKSNQIFSSFLFKDGEIGQERLRKPHVNCPGAVRVSAVAVEWTVITLDLVVRRSNEGGAKGLHQPRFPPSLVLVHPLSLAYIGLASSCGVAELRRPFLGG